MALSFVPPLKSTKRASVLWNRWLIIRAINRLAFWCSLLISVPECPPRSPVASRWSSIPSFLLRVIGRVRAKRSPPAQLTVATPSSSESRLIMVRAERRDLSSASAPFNPISSCVVNTHSSAGCVSVSSFRIASMHATAAPLSPPRVVPFAESTPSFMIRSRGSVVKSCATPASFSHTMSVCPCSITAGFSLAPALAGFLMITLKSASRWYHRFRSSANATR